MFLYIVVSGEKDPIIFVQLPPFVLLNYFLEWPEKCDGRIKASIVMKEWLAHVFGSKRDFCLRHLVIFEFQTK